jgi:hypothetical protein
VRNGVKQSGSTVAVLQQWWTGGGLLSIALGHHGEALDVSEVEAGDEIGTKVWYMQNASQLY